MIKITKPILSTILQNQFKLNTTQTQQVIRYFSTLNDNNNNDKYKLLKSNIISTNNINRNIKGLSFFKISPTTLLLSQRQYSTITPKQTPQSKQPQNQDDQFVIEDDEKEVKEKKQVNEEVFNIDADENQTEQLKLRGNQKQTNVIYSLFSILFVSITGVAIYNMIEEYKNSSTNPLGMPSYDAILLLQDIYFGDLKPAMEKGNPDFDSLTKKNYYFDEAGIRNHSTADTTTLIVPIRQKKTRHDLGNINVDFIKEGKYITIENFYINAINGYHYPLETPEEKIDTTLDRYSGRYSLEELLADPTLGVTENI